MSKPFSNKVMKYLAEKKMSVLAMEHVDLSASLKSGSISEADLRQCEDFTMQAFADGNCILNLKKDMLPVEVVRSIRENSGLNRAMVRKIRLEEEPLDYKRWAHYCTLTVEAPKIAQLNAMNLADVDGKYDDVFPTAADISLISIDSTVIKLILIDIKSHSSSSEALDKLREQSLSLYGHLNLELHLVILKVPMLDMRFLSGATEMKVPKELMSSSKEMILRLGELIATSKNGDSKKLERALKKTVGKHVTDNMTRIYKETTASDDLKDEADLLIKTLSAHGVTLEDLNSMVEGYIPDLHARHYAIHDIIKETPDKFPIFSKLYASVGEGMILDGSQKDLELPISFPCSDKMLKNCVVKKLYSYDPIMHAMSVILEYDDSQEARATYGVLPNGTVQKLKSGQCPSFSRNQTRSKEVDSCYVAVLRRVSDQKMVHVKRDTQDILENGNLKALKGIDGMTAEILKRDYQLVEMSTLRPGFQVLINNVLYRDEGIETLFKSRRGEPKTRYEKWPDDPDYHKTVFKNAMDHYKSFVDDSLGSKSSNNSRAKQMMTTHNKVVGLCSLTGPPCLKEKPRFTHGVINSDLLGYYDMMGSLGRSYSSIMQKHTPANFMTLVDVPNQMMAALVFINSDANHFKTTWHKCIVAGTSKLSQHAPLGKLHYLATANKDIPLVDYIKLQIPAWEEAPASSLTVQCSKFRSFNRADLDWWIERPLKAITRAYALNESRMKLYGVENSDFTMKKGGIREGVSFGKAETAVNLLGYIKSDQQKSIECTAIRYLAQSLGSLDVEEGAILRKLKGIRLKTKIMVAHYFRMASTYLVAALLKSSVGVKALQSSNGETFWCLPDLLQASSDVHVNVSCYASYAQINPEKFARADTEAQCVQGVWDLRSAYLKARASYSFLVDGMLESTAKQVLELLEGKTSSKSALVRLAESIKSGTINTVAEMEAISKLPKGVTFVSSNWFEIYAHLAVRNKYGTTYSISNLAGESIKDLFTMRGSIVEKAFEGLNPVASKRKVSGMMYLLAEYYGIDLTAGSLDPFAEALSSIESKYIDLYQLALGYIDGSITPTALIQLSEKDAPGKAREIATLSISYGIMCIITEKLFVGISHRIPEDIIGASDKNKVVNDVVRDAYSSKHENTNEQVFFVNRDLSSHGPTHKESSSLITTCILSPDVATLRFFSNAVLLSSTRTSRYPHELIRHALAPELQKGNESEEYIATKNSSNSLVDPDSMTSRVCGLIREQYEKGNKYGDKGSVWIKLQEGYPGQGIFGTQASVSHACICRVMTDSLRDAFGWDAKFVVNSDDSMARIKVKADQVHGMKLSLRHILSRTIHFGGLIENESKFTPTSKKAEMVSVFFLKQEPAAQSWKFADALVAPQTGAGLAEDLLKSVSAGASVMKEGASAFLGMIVACAHMSATIDYHNAWPLYAEDLRNALVDMRLPEIKRMPEEGGLPSTDVTAAILSPVGHRLASYVGAYIDSAYDSAYARYLVSSLLQVPVKSPTTLSSDLRPLMETTKGAVLLSADGSEEGTIGNMRMIPSVDGMTVMLRRRKGTIRLAKELGSKLSGMSEYESRCPDLYSPAGILGYVSRSFRKPLTAEEKSNYAHCQIADLTHSSDYPSIRLEKTSLYNGIFKKSEISMREFLTGVGSEAASTYLRSLFLEKISQPITFPAWLSSVCEELVRDAVSIIEICRDLAVSTLIKGPDFEDLEEHRKFGSVKRHVAKKYLDIGVNTPRKVSAEDLTYGFLSDLIDVREVGKLEPRVRRKVVVRKETEGMSMEEAVLCAELMATRFSSAMPGRYRVLGSVELVSSSAYSQQTEWVRHSAMAHSERRLRGEKIEARSAENSGSGLIDLEVNSDVMEETKLAARQKLLSVIRNKPVVNLNPSGGSDLIYKGVSSLVVGGNDGVHFGVEALLESDSAAWLLSNSKVKVLATPGELYTLLTALASRGAYGSANERYKVHGPLLVRTDKVYGGMFMVDKRVIEGALVTYEHSFVFYGDYEGDYPSFEKMDLSNMPWLSDVFDNLYYDSYEWHVHRQKDVRNAQVRGHAVRYVDKYYTLHLDASRLVTLVQVGLDLLFHINSHASLFVKRIDTRTQISLKQPEAASVNEKSDTGVDVKMYSPDEILELLRTPVLPETSLELYSRAKKTLMEADLSERSAAVLRQVALMLLGTAGARPGWMPTKATVLDDGTEEYQQLFEAFSASIKPPEISLDYAQFISDEVLNNLPDMSIKHMVLAATIYSILGYGSEGTGIGMSDEIKLGEESSLSYKTHVRFKVIGGAEHEDLGSALVRTYGSNPFLSAFRESLKFKAPVEAIIKTEEENDFFLEGDDEGLEDMRLALGISFRQ